MQKPDKPVPKSNRGVAENAEKGSTPAFRQAEIRSPRAATNPLDLEHHEVTQSRHQNRRVAANAEKGFFGVTTLRTPRLHGSNVCFVVKSLSEFYSDFARPKAY